MDGGTRRWGAAGPRCPASGRVSRVPGGCGGGHPARRAPGLERVCSGKLMAADTSRGYVRGQRLMSGRWLQYGLIDLKIFTKAESPDLPITDVPSLGWVSSPAARLEHCCSPWFAKEFCFLQHSCCCVPEQLRKSYFLFLKYQGCSQQKLFSCERNQAPWGESSSKSRQPASRRVQGGRGVWCLAGSLARSVLPRHRL